MTARDVDFLELWIERNVLPRSGDRSQASRLAQKLEFDAGVEGLSVQDLEVENNDIEGYIEDIIVHVGEPGMPSD